MADCQELRRILARIDGRGYKAYKDIRGRYAFDGFDLFIDHVQGDPFASPSKVRVRAPQDAAAMPADLFRGRHRRIALEDFLARQAYAAIGRIARSTRGTGKSGLFSIDAGAQEILERTAVVVTDDWVEARLEVGLPAAGRRVLGRQAQEMLCGDLPRIIERSLFWRNVPQDAARAFVACAENQEHVRGQLDALGLVAFVADGAVLPRLSGASDRPLPAAQAVPFRSPDSLRVRIEVPNAIQRPADASQRPADVSQRSSDASQRPADVSQRSSDASRCPADASRCSADVSRYSADASQLPATSTTLTGMGIPRGVTLIVGGGYHGKSTLLRAIERGVYAHIPGDGREYVVTAPDVVKTRAEDGRRVEQVDICPFIGQLPHGRSTSAFCSDDASGSTSQAANIIEAIEVGATCLLLDEDSSATNFMVRDARMQALVHKDDEPITPFLDRVRELHDNLGVSTVMVMGGCGDYFDAADTVIMMRQYVPIDVTAEAKRVARAHPTRRRAETTTPISARPERIPLAESFDPSRGRRDVKIDAKARDRILFGREPIDLRAVEQLVDISQTRAIGHAIHLATRRYMDGSATLRAIARALDELFDREGLDVLDPYRRGEEHPGNFARPRRYEIAAAINRLRTVRMRQRH